MDEKRFIDNGLRLVALADEFLVRCPRCDAAARVAREWDSTLRDWSAATAACASCGYSRRERSGLRDWVGPVVVSARCRCGHCGRPLAIEQSTMPSGRDVTLDCEGCGTATRTDYTVQPVTVPDALVDSCFGLPLWLRTPCAGHELWAFNARHLAHLKAYLRADLREDRAPHNRSMVSRLPGWLKQAKHRDEALRAVTRLERTLP